MNLGLYAMAAMYVIAGVFHFIKPQAYLTLMPSYIPHHRAMIFWSGVAEVLLGLGLLFKATRTLAIWGIIAMLIVFFTVHIDMLSNERIKGKLPKWFIWLRLPMQLGLIYWAYLYL